MSAAKNAGQRSRSMVVAVVLGTAVAALSPDARAVQHFDEPAVVAISKYCQACWRNARLPEDDWGDCTQQVFTRLLERVERGSWSNVFDEDRTERKEFLRAIDAVKKRTQRSRKGVGHTSDVSDWRSQASQELRDNREALATAAAVVLSPRQRDIVELTRRGWAVPEIADALQTTVERVSDEKYKAIRKLQSHFDRV